MLHQATLGDTSNLEELQSQAYGTVGLSVGKAELPLEWFCPEQGCELAFPTKQAMRMHHVQMHGGFHMAQLYADGHSTLCRQCMFDWHTRSRLIIHLKRGYRCLNSLRLRAPNGWGHGREEHRGSEYVRRHRLVKVRAIGPPAPGPSPS